MKKFIKIIIIILIIDIIGNGLSVWFYQYKDEAQKADVIIVLGAAAYPSRVSSVFQERLNHGIDLLNDGYASYILITGGVAEGNKESDAAIGKKYVLSQGVSNKKVLLEEESTITYENLRNAKKIMDKKGLKSAILVSDPIHMKRSMLMASDCGIEAYSSPTPTSKYESRDSKIQFLLREQAYYMGYKIYRIFQQLKGLMDNI